MSFFIFKKHGLIAAKKTRECIFLQFKCQKTEEDVTDNIKYPGASGGCPASIDIIFN